MPGRKQLDYDDISKEYIFDYENYQNGRISVADIAENHSLYTKGEIFMNLLEYLKQHENEEVAVFDKDYDIETYFEYSDKDSKDNWDRAMDRIAEHLEVTEEMDENKRVYEEVPCVLVNMMEVMEQSIETGVMDDLFISKNIDAVMNDMPNILAGYVSEEWLMDFADALDKAESFQQEKESRTAEALEM